MTDLRRAALRGTFWSALQQVGSRGIRILVYLVLARLLAPEAFGVVALSLVYIEFLHLFLNQGLTAAIVQRERLEADHLDSAFWGNVGFGVLLGAGCFVTAGVFARVVGEPEVAAIVRGLSVAFVITALSAVQDAVLRRAMRFQALAVRSLAGQVAATAAALALVLLGFGVWGLVALELVNNVVGVVVLWRASTWRPRLRFSPRHYGELFAFGVHLLGVHLLGFFRLRADTFLIGAFLGTTALGYYAIARQLVNAVSRLVTGSVGPVMWSTFARLQKEPLRLGRAVLSSAEMLALVTWPAYLGIAAVAPVLVPVVLGARWLPSVPVVQAFAVVAVVHSITGSNATAITAIGAMRWRVALEVALAAVTVGAVGLALPGGIVAVAWALAVSLVVMLPVQLAVGARLLPVTLGDYVTRLRVPVVGAALMMGVVVLLLRTAAMVLSGPLLLAVGTAAGAAVYCGFLLLVVPTAVRNVLANLRVAVTRTSEAGAADFGIPGV